MAPRNTIFLHSGFRAGSTWFWHRFRAAAGTYAYYEPYHERLATLTADAAMIFGPQHWTSGHPALAAPYFSEYRPLLAPKGGLPLYQARFAAAAYYETGADEDQAAYIRSLVDHAQRAGTVPVFGFCRSLARVPWFRGLGYGVNIVTWRNPWDQWVSCRDQAVLKQNWYFLFRYLLFASFGNRHPLYASFFAGLDLPPPPAGLADGQLEGILGYFAAAAIRTHFRVFLRVYMLDTLISLHHADHAVDLDALGDDADYRRRITASLRDACSLDDLSFDDCALPRHDKRDDADYAACFDEASTLLEGVGAPLAGAHACAAPLLRRAMEDCRRRVG
ncbi:MAG TPA: hypothetical protein VLX85_03270 [Stellaceae bacterium]|nr:hypothetical protein [Stellaceae bacterium]